MAMNNPQISFLVPFRWFTDDKDFLEENLKRMIQRARGKDELGPMDGVVMYRIHVVVYSSEYVDLPITKPKIQKMLKKVFPNGKCLSASTQFQQNGTYKSPVCDFQIYF